MPKRKYSDDKEERWRKKIRKYEEKLTRNRRDNYELFSSEDERERFRDESPLSLTQFSPARSLASVVRTPCNVNSLEDEPHPDVTLPGPSVATVPIDEPTATVLTIDDAANSLKAGAPNSTETSDVPPADPELLLALGDFEIESNDWGPNISEDLAKRWEPILKDGLKKEVKEELIKKCLYPKNCPLIKPPILNPEIIAMLNESARNRDTRILEKQTQLGCALTMLGKTMSDILTKSTEMSAILRNLFDTAKIIANSHYLETETRRALVTPMIDKTFIEPFKDRKRDSHLFGDKLGDFIKSSRGIQKTGKLIQSVSSANNLNSKAPPSRTQSSYRGARQQIRGGGGGMRVSFASTQAYRRRPTSYQPPSARGQRASTPPPPPSQRRKQPGMNKQKQ